MGRLASRRARMATTVAALVVLPLAALLESGLRAASGAPVLTFTVGLLVAYLLCVGPRGAVVAWYGFTVEGVIGTGAPLVPGLVVTAGAQAAVLALLVWLLELRFAHHGPVRRPIVMVEFALLAGIAAPVAVEAVALGLGGGFGLGLVPGTLAHCATAAGIGVLAVTPGVRMLAKRQVRLLDSTRLPGAVGAVVLSSIAVLTVVLVVDENATDAAQLVAIPILALALLAGTVAYSLAVFATTLAVTIPLAVTGAVATVDVSTTAMVSWWVVGALGLLLATDGDRRHAIAAEFRSFFLRSATPSLTVNTRDGRVLRANDAVVALVGVPADDLVGQPLARFLPDDLRGELRAVRDGTRDELTTEFALDVADGGERWVRCMAVRVGLGGPQHDVVQVQFTDLTPERDRAVSLERTNDSLERFGRRVTHDLKQPVTAVAAYAATLLEHGDRMEHGMVRTMHERLAAAARRAVQQLDDTFAAAAARDPGTTDVRLHELVADVVGVLDLTLDDAGASVATNLLRGHVHSDPASIRQILLNLIANSVKYARPDETPRISISSRVRGAGVEIVLTDNGQGIPEGDAQRVFERGVRLTPAVADGGGHGLADSRELAEALGGTLEVEPWPDGARVVLWLPDPAAADAQTPTRVLVVGPEERAEEVERRLANRSAVRLVGAASTVGGAVTAAADAAPDVVLVDRGFAETAGDDGLVELARAHRDARIVLLDDGPATTDPPDPAVRGAVRVVDLRMRDDALLGGLVGSPV